MDYRSNQIFPSKSAGAHKLIISSPPLGERLNLSIIILVVNLTNSLQFGLRCVPPPSPILSLVTKISWRWLQLTVDLNVEQYKVSHATLRAPPGLRKCFQ